MIIVDAMGDACPLPVIKTKKAIMEINNHGEVEVLVDNEIAMQNVSKMAVSQGGNISVDTLGENAYKVKIVIGSGEESVSQEIDEKSKVVCSTDYTVMVFESDCMGRGNEELGRVLIKGFIYAVTELENLPNTMIFYNSGALLTAEGSDSIEDLQLLREQGVEVLTCGTCLDYYNKSDKLEVGEVTNMYTIVEKLAEATKIIKP